MNDPVNIRRLERSHHKNNKLSNETIAALTEATAPHRFTHPVQFAFFDDWVKPQISRQSHLQEAHNWLSENSTGPWVWSDYSERRVAFVYVERQPDQERFRDAYGHLFNYHANLLSEIGQIAILRGVLPLYGPKESFRVWKAENTSFSWRCTDGIVRISFTVPSAEEKFRADWGDLFSAEELKRGVKQYVGPFVFGRIHEGERNFHTWIHKNSAFSETYRDLREYRFEVRYPESIAAVERDWGHVWKLKEGASEFSANADGKIFGADGYPILPVRTIPEDFVAYLLGESETFEAPYAFALSVKAAREQAIGIPARIHNQETRYEHPLLSLKNLELWAASATGKGSVIGPIVKQGASIHSATPWGDTALHLSLEERFPKTAEALVKNGADPYHPNRAGAVPIVTALNDGFIELANRMVKPPVPDELRPDIRGAVERQMHSGLSDATKKTLRAILFLAR